MTKIEHALLNEQSDINASLCIFEENLRNVSRYLVGDAPPPSGVTPEIPDNSGSPLLSQLHYGNMDIRSKISSINEVLNWIKQMSGYDDNAPNLKQSPVSTSQHTVSDEDWNILQQARQLQKKIRPAAAKRPYTRKAKKAARR